MQGRVEVFRAEQGVLVAQMSQDSAQAFELPVSMLCAALQVILPGGPHLFCQCTRFDWQGCRS